MIQLLQIHINVKINFFTFKNNNKNLHAVKFPRYKLYKKKIKRINPIKYKIRDDFKLKLYDKIISAGHSVGNHSMTHLNGWKVDKKKYLFDVKKASELINSNLFRPPYGKINIRSISKLKKKFNIIMWDINSGDFDRGISSKEVISNVVASSRNGSIVVLHDNENFKFLTLPSLLPIIKGLKEKGFSFRAIPYHPLK